MFEGIRRLFSRFELSNEDKIRVADFDWLYNSCYGNQVGREGSWYLLLNEGYIRGRHFSFPGIPGYLLEFDSKGIKYPQDKESCLRRISRERNCIGLTPLTEKMRGFLHEELKANIAVKLERYKWNCEAKPIEAFKAGF